MNDSQLFSGLARSILFSCALLLLATQASAQDCSAVGDFPAAPGAYTHKAIGSGLWNNTALWDTGTLPDDDSIVCIPPGKDIRVGHQDSAEIRYIRVEGKLRMRNSSNSRLYVETLFVADSGEFLIGLPMNEMEVDKTAEIIFLSSAEDGTDTNTTIDPDERFDFSWDENQASRGLISAGTVKLYGSYKTPFVTMSGDALIGDTTLEVDVDLDTSNAGWRVGDEILITGTYFKRDTDTREEVRTIQSISGDEITLTQALSEDHRRADPSLKLHVANLTRNIVFTSDDPSETFHRGHVMFMNADVDIHNVSFIDLGRTDKKIPLDDVILRTFDHDGDGEEDDPVVVADYTGEVWLPDPDDVANRRGRYAVHFHKNGIDPSASTPPSKVYDSVVVGTPGWAFANHSSHVDFQGNIAYDFDGAGFVTEAGDELGNFIGNLAVRGNGLSTDRYPGNRIVFDNVERPQPLSDFAFLGDGFWFQGPAIRAIDNVANGCHGTGMLWFTTGAPDALVIDGNDQNHYVGFPISAMDDVYGPDGANFSDYSSFVGRTWMHAPDQHIIADLPILECDGVEAYANHRGFKIRFSNMASLPWFYEGEFGYDDDIKPVDGKGPAYAIRMTQTVSDLTLWNNEMGMSTGYATKTDHEDLTLINRLAFLPDNGPHIGVEFVSQVDYSSIDNVSVDGYVIAGWTVGGPAPATSTNSISNESYSNYAMYDTYELEMGTPTCPDVANISASQSGSTLTLTWDSDTDHDRYLVRYWVDGDESFVEYEDLPGSSQSLDVTAASGADSYTFQVTAGCEDEPSKLWQPVTPLCFELTTGACS